ncbi:hypothetical protein PFTANZ_06510, partial [Plasmodium falciparum Tanzania (2000708)]
MAPSTTYSSAKDFLDKIGQQVHDLVKTEANQYKVALTGQLSLASIWKESAAFTDPCDFIKNEGYKILAAHGDPCGNTNVDRFPDKEGAECDKSKIKDNKGKTGGACAPYRRLSLCNKNMEKMGRTSTTKHDLLADVCMAANYEAQSLIPYHDKYKQSNEDSKICTVLARSFADIGDIVRGRDLYDGKKKRGQTERDKLEENFKKYFQQIHDE